MKWSLEQILLVSALFLFGIATVGTGFIFENIEKPSKNSALKDVVAFKPSGEETLAGKISTPQVWDEKEHKLFVARLLVYTPKLRSTKPLNLADIGPDGIPYQWRKDNGFSLDDPTVAQADPDGDGFTNLEEFKAGTNPNDKTMSPPPIYKLRIDKFVAVPFKIIFRGYTLDAGDKYTYQLNMQNKSLLARKGDFINISQFKIDKAGWRVGDFRLVKAQEVNSATGVAEEVDKSELDLYHPLLQDQKITLIRNMPLETDESRIDFVGLIPGYPAVTQISKGQIFQFQGKKYQLLNASPEEAEIKDIESGSVTKVYPLNQDEKEKVHPNAQSATGTQSEVLYTPTETATASSNNDAAVKTSASSRPPSPQPKPSTPPPAPQGGRPAPVESVPW